MIDDIFVFDNIIDSKAQKHIQDIVFDKIKWRFIPDVTNPKQNKQQRPGFRYDYIIDKIVYRHHNDMIGLIDAACDKINFKRKDCIQGRSFLQLPLNLNDRQLDAPHIDTDKDHLVILYYVNDSDGDTVIYKNHFVDINTTPKFEELEELKRVTPKSGRVVMFNGRRWHTAAQPVNNVRCIINYNVI